MPSSRSHTLTANIPPPSNQEAQWISLSDLMTGLMMIFMLIALSFMMKVEDDAKKNEQRTRQASIEQERARNEKEQASAEQERLRVEQEQARKVIAEALEKERAQSEEQARRVKQVAVLYDEIRHALYRDLHYEFDRDLQEWGAEITPDLAVRFSDPDVLFSTGKDALKPKFQMILEDFFPRYVRIITSEKFKNSIREIRIEGHTSSIWSANTPLEEAYYKNMELSQSRTRSTLRFLLGLPAIKYDEAWLQSLMTANGLSSAQLIRRDDGSEDAAKSQRVEFRIRTDAEERIENILEYTSPPTPQSP